jgi:hypothetical protein
MLEMKAFEALLQNIPSKGEYNDALDDARAEFVERFHCSYEFTDDGVQLLNSDTEDMRWTINDFVESGCKDWDEFSLYLFDTIINIFKTHAKEK